MKARIPPQNILTKQQRQACIEYCEKLQDGNNNRLFKLFCYHLNRDFHFGADRLSRLIKSVEKTTAEIKTNEVFWEQLDREMKKIGLQFENEEYEDIIGNWKNENQIE